MGLSKNFLALQLITVLSEVASLSFLFHCVLHDFRSWNQKFLSPKIQPQSESSNSLVRENEPTDIYTNCSEIFRYQGKLVDFRRSTVFGTVNFIGLLFFWWVNSLNLCIHFRALTSKAKWLSLLLFLVWLVGGGLILVSFLIQMKTDEEGKRQPCVYSRTVTDNIQLCQSVLCQAATSKLVAFGFAFLSGWLHLLSFIALLGHETRDETTVESKSSINISSILSSHGCSSLSSCSNRLFPEFSSSHLGLFPFNIRFPHFNDNRSFSITSNHAFSAWSKTSHAKPPSKKSVRFDAAVSDSEIKSNRISRLSSRANGYTDSLQKKTCKSEQNFSARSYS